ncbi:MAG: hypothetical protein NTW78_08780 [Campylobacterales bacterium]|nr:hypothetical protein [Campylobacterales bacterium]
MSFRNDMDMVKEELSSEEKFFEKAVITERFVKKYKNLIIGSFVAVVVVAFANIVYDVNKQNRIESANKALSDLRKDANNSDALAKLKSLSPNLHDVWLYSKAVADKDLATLEKLKDTKAMLVGDLTVYEIAQNTKDAAKLDAYALSQNAVYKDLAQVQSAVLLMNEGKVEAAHQKLSLIGEQSPLNNIAKALLHYGVK